MLLERPSNPHGPFGTLNNFRLNHSLNKSYKIGYFNCFADYLKFSGDKEVIVTFLDNAEILVKAGNSSHQVSIRHAKVICFYLS